MTVVELDTMRADMIHVLLNEKGRQYIWRYDVGESRHALAEAVDRQNYDGIIRGIEARRDRKPYVLIGAGIEDHYFTTPGELAGLVVWLCRDGYLSCYARSLEGG